MNSGGIEFMYQFGNLQSEEYACPEVSIVIYNPLDDYEGDTQEIGRASCRERVFRAV